MLGLLIIADCQVVASESTKNIKSRAKIIFESFIKRVYLPTLMQSGAP